MLLRLLLVLVTITATLVPNHAASATTQNERLIDNLDYFEVIEVTSPTHALTGATNKQAQHTMAFDGQPFRLNNGLPQQHPHLHSFSFEAHGQKFQVQLEKNERLFAPSYSESYQHWTTDGVRTRELEPEPRSLSQVEHCFYQGKVAEERGRAGIHTCDGGFTGLILVSAGEKLGEKAESYVIEPAHKHLDHSTLHSHVQSLSNQHDRPVNPHSLHIVYKMKDSRTFRKMGADGFSACGVAEPDEAETAAFDAWQAERRHERTLSAHHGHALEHEEYDLFRSHLGVEREEEELQVVQEDEYVNAETGEVTRLSSSGRGRSLASDPIPAERYVELFVANDRLRYQALETATETRSAAIVNVISTLYSKTAFTPATLTVTLIGQVTFFNADPWNITTGGCSAAQANEMCVDKLLSTWNEWRRNPDNTAPYQNNDAGHLFSGYKFQSVVLGYAGVGAMCNTAQSGGIEQATNDDDGFNAVIAAHELGHNLGMQHDSSPPACPQSGFIMNAVVNGGNPPDSFSPCSLDYYNKWSLTGAGTCLNNVPTQRYGAAVCGNGYVEAGEQCDCGPYAGGKDSTTVAPNYCQTSSLNPCCDALSCQFILEAECSNTDKCCTNCHVSSASEQKECRAAANSCDIAETCDGTSSECPFDDNVGNGKDCVLEPYARGACFEGQCQSHQRQCDEIGKQYSGGPWLPCPVQLELNEKQGLGYCGDLYCTDQPGSGTTTCTYFDLSSHNVSERMADGNPCGAKLSDGYPGSDQMCYNGDCVAADATNTRFIWATTDWEKCSDCDGYQSRNISCVRATNGQQVNEVLCSSSGKPATSQQCSDEELLCDHTVGGSLKLTILGHEVEVSTPVVVGTSVGIFFFLLMILQACTACIVHRDTDKKLKLSSRPKAASKPQNQI